LYEEIITGASSGLGEALALYYATNENRLVLIARREDRLNDVAQRCRVKGAEVEMIIADVNNFERMREIGIDLSEKPIDRIILNAGISVGHSGGITPFEDFHRLFQTNFLSVHALLEPIIPKMMSRNQERSYLFPRLHLSSQCPPLSPTAAQKEH
jgi:short-subunit dehydrogenase